MADRQDGGRGRLGRTWVSEPGNLYATFLFAISAGPEIAAQAGLVAAVAVQEAVSRLRPDLAVRIKWPNDLLIGGAKFCGILSEVVGTAPTRIAIGCGINVAHAPKDTPYPATALGPRCTVESVFQELDSSLSNCLKIWDEGRGFGAIRAAWSAAALGIGGQVTASIAGEATSGIFAGIAPDGALLLQTGDGRLRPDSFRRSPFRRARRIETGMNAKKKFDHSNDLVFLPLGGTGEIGMNCYCYGVGPADDRSWLMVDLGVKFGEDTEPGIDVVLPDVGFIASDRRNLAGIVLTHAHEDHLGAVAWLWPQLQCPVYCSPFAAQILALKLKEAGLDEEVPVKVQALGSKFKVGPFDLEFVSVTHSIPEPSALLIKTKQGTVLHSGDWKIDRSPVLGRGMDESAAAPDRRCGRRCPRLRFDECAARGPFPLRGRRGGDHRAHRGRSEGPRCHHHLRLACRPDRNLGARRAGRWPRGGRGRPRHAQHHRGGARLRVSRATPAGSSTKRSSATCRPTRSCCSAPAARASRAPPSRALPRTSIRTCRWNPATS